ncbi:MAG: haloacid dehalogenase-like hydrolase, partial [Deltaproteobacteria bacterium]|nr:haloacid dehalogenase-like hydrolase [Deltaproteobacteria bacterium]MBW2534121.1 haloacid dehalogenase-like hydrolase [Deltaproteobacteria bacterium]
MPDYELPPRSPASVPEFVRALPREGRGALAIFDADGTLWRDDVADDFARWMMEQGHVPDGGRWAEYVRIYRGDPGAGCDYMLTFYRGMRPDELREHLRGWWSRARRRWVTEVLESLYLLAERHYAIWVVTGSPTETMLPLKEFLPVD